MYDRLKYGDITNALCKKLSEYFGCSGGKLYRDASTAILSVYKLLQHLHIDTVVTSPFSAHEWYTIGRNNEFNVLFPHIVQQSLVLQPLKQLQNISTQDIKHKTAALLPNQYGYIEDIESYHSNSAILIEDVSDCIGSQYQSKPVGTFGNIVIISMESDNILTTGGGTAILIRDRSLLKQYNDVNKSTAPASLLADYNSALGLSQFAKLATFIDIRKRVYLRFHRAIQKPHYNPDQPYTTSYVPNFFPVVLSGSKKECVKLFSSYGVEVRGAFERTIAYHNPSLYTVVENEIKTLINQTILVPLNSSLSEQAVERIEQILSQLP